MESLPVHLFKDSFGPFMSLLNEHNVAYSMREQRSGVQMAASGVVEVLQTAAMWGSLASVIIAFLKYRHSRKVIITTKENEIIHAEGLTHKELESILTRAKSLTAIETTIDET